MSKHRIYHLETGKWLTEDRLGVTSNIQIAGSFDLTPELIRHVSDQNRRTTVMVFVKEDEAEDFMRARSAQ